MLDLYTQLRIHQLPMLVQESTSILSYYFKKKKFKLISSCSSVFIFNEYTNLFIYRLIFLHQFHIQVILCNEKEYARKENSHKGTP